VSLAPSYAVLCAVQAAVVAVPQRPARPGRLGWLGIVLPALALAVGIGVLRGFSGGPHALALLGAVATPVLAAAGPLRAPVAAALWVVAWLAHGLVAEAAGVALVAMAALRVASLARELAPAWSLELGLVALVVLDVVLVWGTPQVEPASTALHAAVLPAAAGHPIPRLQDATLGDATMGWLDLLAPALLGAIVPPGARLRAAAATGLAAGAWGLLLFVTAQVAATVPVLAGLAAVRVSGCASRSSPTSTAT
jgi:hypothetical protein